MPSRPSSQSTMTGSVLGIATYKIMRSSVKAQRERDFVVNNM